MQKLTALKHQLLGYWPVLAHAANIVSHWQSVRERVKQALEAGERKTVPWLGPKPSEAKIKELDELMGDPDFHLVDSHIEELAHALYLQGFNDIVTAGRRAGQWPGVPPIYEFRLSDVNRLEVPLSEFPAPVPPLKAVWYKPWTW